MTETLAGHLPPLGARLPLVASIIMGITVAVWVFVQGAGFSPEALTGSVCAFGSIPAEITRELGRAGLLNVEEWIGPSVGVDGVCRMGGLTCLALLTSVFLHGSWMHLIGNLWFLWIFGNNVEDSMGHGRFLLFYLLTGLIAGGSHVASDPGSVIPMVGASGAISAIMGAYLLLYPRARVHTLFFFVIFFRVIRLPAWFFLLYWLSIQLVSSALQPQSGGGGVAFWAHIGGFAAGLALATFFQNPALVRAKRAGVRLHRRELKGRGWW